MKELTYKEASDAAQDLKTIAAWGTLVEFIKDKFPSTVTTFKPIVSYDEYNDQNYYSAVKGVICYDEAGKSLRPTEYQDEEEFDEYSWFDEYLYDLGFGRENGLFLPEKSYNLSSPPKTKYTKFFAEETT